jgi:acetylornithine/succinyldiaminopimelate/putrescine aminotransferase
MKNWQKLADKYYMNTGVRAPVTLVKGRGALAWDDKGNEFYD